MSVAPKQQPLIDIPGIDDAKLVRFETWGRGEGILFKLYVDNQEVKLDQAEDYMNHGWLGLVAREMDRRNWKYTIVTHKDKHVWHWSSKKAA